MDLLLQDFDLLIDKATNDLASIDDESQILLSQIIEAFDMSPADDIDFPEIYSLQRTAMNSDDKTDDLRRIQDAKRILNYFPEINQDSVSVELINNGLQLKFKTVTGLNINYAYQGLN